MKGGAGGGRVGEVEGRVMLARHVGKDSSFANFNQPRLACNFSGLGVTFSRIPSKCIANMTMGSNAALY